MFLNEIGSWMSDPKLLESARERWVDIGGRVDSGHHGGGLGVVVQGLSLHAGAVLQRCMQHILYHFV